MNTLSSQEIAAVIRAYKKHITLESISSVLNIDIALVRRIICQYYTAYAVVQDMVG